MLCLLVLYIVYCFVCCKCIYVCISCICIAACVICVRCVLRVLRVLRVRLRLRLLVTLFVYQCERIYVLCHAVVGEERGEGEVRRGVFTCLVFLCLLRFFFSSSPSPHCKVGIIQYKCFLLINTIFQQTMHNILLVH